MKKQIGNGNKELDDLLKRFESKKMKDTEFLAELLLLFKTKPVITSLLYSLLTRSERKTIAARVLIVKMLKANIPQHKISEKLKVGVATVTRGASEIQKGRFDFM
ncbi:MAG: Trp family transcriptional regulator [Patescibacteria group bacterium]